MDKPKFTIPPKLNFIDACLKGSASTDNFEDYVEYWHTHSEDLGRLHEFLGLTEFEYGKLMLHSDCFLDEVLYCRRHSEAMQAAWTPEREQALDALCAEISKTKERVQNQLGISDEESQALLARLGDLMEQKNRITGWDQDVRYLYSTDERLGHFVLGFFGDNIGTVDADGNTLRVGDAVSYTNEKGKNIHHLIHRGANGSTALAQDWLLKQGLRRIALYTETMENPWRYTDIRMELQSCRADYILQQRKEQAAALGLAELLCFPVYWNTAQDACGRGELKLYRASAEASKRCATYINDGTHESMYYPLRKTLAQELVQTFGIERSKYVAASVLAIEDGRIAREVRQWAGNFMEGKALMQWHCTANPGVMSMLGKDLMKLEQRAEQAITEVLASIAPASLMGAQRDLLRNSAWDEALLQQTADGLLHQEQVAPSQGEQILG